MTIPEQAVQAMPERIYAKVHGASTDVISGQRGLIGGWNEHQRDGQAEYVRADLAVLSALEPSAARELALEEIIALCKDYAEDSQLDSEYRLACNDIIEAIQERRALSSTDHADAGKVEGDGDRETLWKSAARDFGAYLASNGTPYAIDYWNECFGPLFSAPASEGAE